MRVGAGDEGFDELEGTEEGLERIGEAGGEAAGVDILLLVGAGELRESLSLSLSLFFSLSLSLFLSAFLSLILAFPSLLLFAA